MLRSGRAPRDRSERMIANNYRAMEYVRRRRNDPLDPEFVLELHDIVTRGTLDNEDEAGRLQRSDEERVAVYSPEEEIIRLPPPAEELPARLEAMCEFANSSDETGVEPSGTFMHPVVRAILLHFWVAFDRPFADGNGRAARALFYWSMLRQGYWLAEFLTISSILKNAPGQYATSYLYTETDDGDTTYFVLYQLRVILRAMDELEGYLERKMEETRKIEALIRNGSGLNHRQTTLLAHALRNPYATYTVKEHSSFHNVVQATARTDLDGLTERGMLVKNKAGRAFRFYLAELDEVQPIQVLVVAQEKPYRHSLSLLSRTLRLAIHLRLRSLSLLWTRPRVPAHPIA
jgi:Fic family protein